MQYNKLEQYISKPRLDRFLVACGNSTSKAEKLYEINLKVAQATYPVLSLFETILRNSVNRQLTIHFSDSDWIINQKNGFMSDVSLIASNFFLRKSIQGAETIIIRKGATVTSGKVIAEQTFGFWTSIFDTHHYKLLKGSVIHCFSNKPSNINRSNISVKLNSVREFRNRVYHNEPICFKGSSIDYTNVKEIISIIYEMLNWIDTDLKTYVEHFDNINNEINAINNI